MPVFGTFDTMQLADVVQWILNTQATGTLIVTIETEETDLFFDHGDVVGVASGNSLRLDFGQALLARDLITEDQLHRAMGGNRDSSSLKTELLAQGILTVGQLNEAEKEYAFDTVLDLFFQQDGQFHFSSNKPGTEFLDSSKDASDKLLASPIPTKSILMDAMRRLDEWNRIKEIFPSNFVVVSAVGEPETDPVWVALNVAKEPISVGDLCLRLGSGRFAVYERLFELYGKGKIALDEINPGQANFAELGSVETLVDNARVLIEEKQYDEAREILGTALNLEPENRIARELLKRLRSSQIEHLYQQIPPHKTPILALSRQDLTSMPLSSKESYLAARLNGKWDVGTLVVATPLGELETLRVLRKLIHAQIVQLI